MATKDELYRIIGAYGLGKVLPRGSTRAAARVAVGTILRTGKVVLPAVARTSVNVARVNPYASAALLGYGAYRGGYLDPVLDPARERFVDPVMDRLEGLEERAEEVIPFLTTKRKRKASSFNRAISASMKAVKASKFMGKKGTLSNSKKAFAKVTKTVAALRAGRKGAASGVTGLIRRTARKFG